MIRFHFEERKALEALVLVADEWRGISHADASRVFFLAEKQHLNQFDRPILGDTYVEMQKGPEPTEISNWFNGNFDLAEDPVAISDALAFHRGPRQSTVTAKRKPELLHLARSEVNALLSAVSMCLHEDYNSLTTVIQRIIQRAAPNGETWPRTMA